MQHPLLPNYTNDFVESLVPVQEMYSESDFEIHQETLYEVSMWYKGTRIFSGAAKQAQVFKELVKNFWSSPPMMLMRNYVEREEQNWMLAIILSSSRDIHINCECLSTPEMPIFESDSPYYMNELYRICVNIGDQHVKSVIKCENEPSITKRIKPVIPAKNLPLEPLVNWADANTKLKEIQDIINKDELINLSKLYITLNFIELLSKYSKKVESDEFIFNVAVSISKKPLAKLKQVKCSKFEYDCA